MQHYTREQRRQLSFETRSPGKLYGNVRLEAACRRAYAMKAIGYKSIESILKHRLDEAPMPADVQPTLPLIHVNLRGADYYH